MELLTINECNRLALGLRCNGCSGVDTVLVREGTVTGDSGSGRFAVWFMAQRNEGSMNCRSKHMR